MWLYLIALVATSAYAASGDDFYERLYSRGVAQFGQGNYDAAYRSLRLAAFGLLDDIPRFETAEIYMTIAAAKLRHDDDARAAAERVVSAERIERRLMSLSLSDDVRNQFNEAAQRLLTADQFALLRGNAPPHAAQPQPRVTEITVPAPIIVPSTQPSAPRPVPTPRTQTPAPQPRPAIATPLPTPAPQPTLQPQPAHAAADPNLTQLTDAERAINNGDIVTARSLYRSTLEWPQLSHANALRVAEGLYRSRDFGGAIRAFERAGTIGTGEEQYHYYYAVALYETGRYTAAKRELDQALPFIEVTPDVARYRTKIEGAIE